LGALKGRLYSEIYVRGRGRCKLTWMEATPDRIICYVRTLEEWTDDQVKVPWREVAATDVPVIRSPVTAAPPPMPNPAEDTTETPTATTETPTATAYTDQARHSRVVLVLSDSKRIRETLDGEVVRDEKVPL
jgi:hypothetical protein